MKVSINKLSIFFIWLFLVLIGFTLIVTLLFNIDNLDGIVYSSREIDSFEVVVARYNEDLSWIKKEFPTEKVTVYNKGKDDLNLPENCKIIKLPNIGREAHTYLYHIINNYNQLSDRTLFLQGGPYSIENYTITPLRLYKRIARTMCKNIIAGKCKSVTPEGEAKKLKNYDRTKWYNTVYKNYDLVEFLKEYINPQPLSYLYVSYGANFAVDKNKILINDIQYYQKIFNTLDNIAPIEGHYLERSWDSIFAKKDNK